MGETCVVVLKCIINLNGSNSSHMVTIHTLCSQVQHLYLSPALCFISSLNCLAEMLAFSMSVVRYEFGLCSIDWFFFQLELTSPSILWIYLIEDSVWYW